MNERKERRRNVEIVIEKKRGKGDERNRKSKHRKQEWKTERVKKEEERRR